MVCIFLYLDWIRIFTQSKSPYFSPNTGKYGPEKTPYLETFHAVGGDDIDRNAFEAVNDRREYESTLCCEKVFVSKIFFKKSDLLHILFR